MKIKECKLNKILNCDKEKNIVNVAKLLNTKNERHCIITDKKNPIGIISITDIANRLVAKGKDPKTTKAKDIMTHPIKTIDSGKKLTDAYIEMMKERIYAFPVVEKNKLKGILEFKEVIKNLSLKKIKK